MPQEIISFVSQLSLLEMGAPFALIVIAYALLMLKVAFGH